MSQPSADANLSGAAASNGEAGQSHEREESKPWYAKAKGRLGVAWQLASSTLDEFSADRGTLMAAAVAFYALLSIAPFAVIAVALAGAVLGSGSAHHQLATVLRQSMGPNAEKTVMGWVDQAAGSVAAGSIVGILVTLWAAARLFGQLREAINQIWDVEVHANDTFKDSLKDYLKQRLFAVAMVFIAGPLLLASFISRALLSSVYGLFGISADALVQAGQIGASLILGALTTAFVFKVVPDLRVDWRSVLVGSSLTSVLLNLGNFLVGLYLGRASVGYTYGAAGSLVVVLLWFYYSAQVFLLGAEFTQVYAARSGREMRPKRSGIDRRKNANAPTGKPEQEPV